MAKTSPINPAGRRSARVSARTAPTDDIQHGAASVMPTLVQDPPPHCEIRRYPARANRTPFPTPPKVITTYDYTPLDHRTPDLPPIHELQSTITALQDNVANKGDDVSVQPQNLFNNNAMTGASLPAA